MATSGNHIFHIGGTTEKFIIVNNGNLYVNSGLLNINAADFSSGGTKGIIFWIVNETPNNNNYNSVLTYDHDANGFCDGLSINGWDGVRFCTGSNTRAERMRINTNGRVGISNSNINISPSKGISIIIKMIYNNHYQSSQKRKEDIKELMYYQKHQLQSCYNQQVIQVILKSNPKDFHCGAIIQLQHQ